MEPLWFLLQIELRWECCSYATFLKFYWPTFLFHCCQEKHCNIFVFRGLLTILNIWLSCKTRDRVINPRHSACVRRVLVTNYGFDRYFLCRWNVDKQEYWWKGNFFFFREIFARKKLKINCNDVGMTSQGLRNFYQFI